MKQFQPIIFVMHSFIVFVELCPLIMSLWCPSPVFYLHGTSLLDTGVRSDSPSVRLSVSPSFRLSVSPSIRLSVSQLLLSVRFEKLLLCFQFIGVLNCIKKFLFIGLKTKTDGLTD